MAGLVTFEAVGKESSASKHSLGKDTFHIVAPQAEEETLEAVGRVRPSRIMEATFSLVSLVGSAVSKNNFQGFFLFILAKGVFYSGQKIINGGLFILAKLF